MEIDLEKIPHHHAVQEIVDTICRKTSNEDRGFFQAEVAYYFGKVASSMGAKIQTKDRGEIPVNVYSIALAPSGYGKNHSMYIMEQEILQKFEERYLKDTFPILSEQNLWAIANRRAARKGTDQNDEFEGVQKEFNDKGTMALVFAEATTPAIRQMREMVLMAGVGSINLQVDEIGLNLSGSVEPLTLFLELYDQGLIKQKLTKNTKESKRSEDLQGKSPANIMMFGTPSKLLDSGKTEELFFSLLDTGYARRSLFGWGDRVSSDGNLSAKEIFERLTETSNDAVIQKWRDHFYDLADPAYYGWTMQVPDSVSIQLIAYKQNCERLAGMMADHEEIRKAEMSHRHSKALKLAGALAFIDNSTEVEMEHLLASIKLVEESGIAFDRILNRERNFVKLAKYIAQSKAAVTHAELHEQLPFYGTSQSARNDMMQLAIAHGYKNNIIIKKYYEDGIELFTGDTLEETNLDAILVSYSNHFAYHYNGESAPFDKLHLMTQADGIHWCNHHFNNQHRAEENVIPGFNMIVLDVDGGTPLYAARELLKDYTHLIYTTKRHTEEENRFRVILPINYQLEMDQTDYREFMDNIMSWLPFPTDESANQRAKKWMSHSGGKYYYNMDGSVLDILPFIPKTSRNEQFKKENHKLDSLDNLERWFAQRISSGNRNNQLLKYALFLVDAGWALVDVSRQVHAFNKKLAEPISEDEIDNTILVTAVRRHNNKAAA